jgi:hypothetical protein
MFALLMLLCGLICDGPDVIPGGSYDDGPRDLGGLRWDSLD